MKKIGMPLLEASGICIKSKKASIDSFNISIGRGDSLAVLHNNIPAADLLTEILSGKTEPNKGKLFFKGENITGQRNNFGVARKKAAISKNKTVTENGAVPLIKRGLSRGIATVAAQKELASFDMQDYGTTTVSALPKNIAYRAELFLAYMWSHDVMVIDEPFEGFFESEKAEELKWLKSVAGKTGLAMLILTQSIDTALALSDTVMAVNNQMSSVGMIGVDRNQLDKTRMRIEVLTGGD